MRAAEVWVPDILEGQPARPAWLTAQSPAFARIPTIDLRDGLSERLLEQMVSKGPSENDPAGGRETSIEHSDADNPSEETGKPSLWFGEVIRRSVDRNLTIRTVIDLGRGLNAEDVLRIRALHKGTHLRSDLQWSGSEILVGEQLTKMAHTQRSLLLSRGLDGSADGDRDLRLRMRIQGIGLEDALLGYAATELIDPVIMDSTLSLDVLCHADLEMTSNVISRLGLARAHHDEVAQAVKRHSFRSDGMWSIVEQAWQTEMAMARGVARHWAESVVKRGRSDMAGSGISVRL